MSIKEEILKNIDNALELEDIYRKNKPGFKSAFFEICDEYKEKELVAAWNARLSYRKQDAFIKGNEKKAIILTIIIAVVFGVLAKIIYEINTTFAKYLLVRNSASGLSLSVAVFTIFKYRIKLKIYLPVIILYAVTSVIINIIPDKNRNNLLFLLIVHSPILLWMANGYLFVNGKFTSETKVNDYLRLLAEYFVYLVIVSIIGVIFLSITGGLFYLIGVNIYKFYFEWLSFFIIPFYILICFSFAASADKKNYISSKVFKGFSILSLVVLIVFLIYMIIKATNPYNNRQALITFDGILVVIFALAVFGISDAKEGEGKTFWDYINASLAVFALIIAGVSLTSLILRFIKFGISQNRIVSIGANFIIIIHSVLILINYFNFLFKNKERVKVKNAIKNYIPLYPAWVLIIIAVFPLVFKS